MTDAELRRFVEEQSVLIVGTVGRDGRPHLTALWYVLRDGEPWIFTYANSQKVRNLERTPQATLLIETGQEYTALRGAMLYADAVVHRERAVVAAVGEELIERYDRRGPAGRPGLDDSTRQAVRARVAKRVAIQFRPRRIVSWDHAKLLGTY
jgi:PPOX class probable F420-dependent enzyme